MAELPSRQTREPVAPAKLRRWAAGGFVSLGLLTLLTLAVCPLIAKAMGFTAEEALRYAEFLVDTLTVLAHVHLVHLAFAAFLALVSLLAGTIGGVIILLVLLLRLQMRRSRR